MLNPMRDKKKGILSRGGGRGDTCDHGLSRKSLRAKPVELEESKRDDIVF